MKALPATHLLHFSARRWDNVLPKSSWYRVCNSSSMVRMRPAPHPLEAVRGVIRLNPAMHALSPTPYCTTALTVHTMAPQGAGQPVVSLGHLARAQYQGISHNGLEPFTSRRPQLCKRAKNHAVCLVLRRGQQLNPSGKPWQQALQ